jgi:hypothetical protein
VLRQLATRRAEPEICDHLVVYRGEEILALAHDAGRGDLLVARALSPSVVERMRTILCRERAAVAAPFSADAPVPRCDRCRDVDPESVALPAQPKIAIRDRLASLTWGVVIGAVVVIVVRGCAR